MNNIAIHFDDSGRLQTVYKKINSKFYFVIKEFEKLSGFPIVLNTSINVSGMPLVETPSNAINCFYQSGIDYLILHNIVIKNNNDYKRSIITFIIFYPTK